MKKLVALVAAAALMAVPAVSAAQNESASVDTEAVTVSQEVEAVEAEAVDVAEEDDEEVTTTISFYSYASQYFSCKNHPQLFYCPRPAGKLPWQ